MRRLSPLKRRMHSGFTLIELIIAIAIVAILAAIAYPSYSDYVLRGKRADGHTGLLEAASWLERMATQNGAYNLKNDGSVYDSPAAASTALTTAGYGQSPKSGQARYTIQLSAINATTYVLQAVPVAPFNDPACGVLSLTDSGVKGATGAGTNPAAVNRCWGQ